MSGPRGWLALRLSLRLGRYRWLLRFPPRFHQWKLIAVLAILLPVGYVVGCVPTVKALRRVGATDHPAVQQSLEVVYAPLIWLDINVPWCHQCFEIEGELLTWMFGE